jgi:PKD repeat protein
MGCASARLLAMRLTRLICLGALAGTLVPAATAAAQVQPAGTGEPAYTNSAQNTQWFEWPAVSGAGAYKIRFDYYENNALKASPAYAMPNGAVNVWANWSGVATLAHGGQYGICAQGSYAFPNDSLFIADGPNSCSMGTMLGRRAYTTIDRSKPAAAMALAGGAAYVKDPKVPVKVDFSDDVAGPFPANFLCFQKGGGPGALCDTGAGYIYGYSSSCSVPAGGGKSTTFSCTADYGAAPDGPLWACVIAADASIPDNPSSSNQSQSAEKANLSTPACDGVVLDRTAPAASIAASAAAVHVGDLVTFDAQASDATSGLAARANWTWGDNTAAGSGASATHTFTAAGTYAVKLTVEDNAGNVGTATKVIAVTAAPAPTPTPTPSPTPSPSPSPTPSPTPAPVPHDDGDDAVDDAPEPAPELDLDAPRRVKAKSRSIRVALTADAPGRVQLALVRGGRVVSRGATGVAAGTRSYRLKLPKRAKAGAYTLKATYSPDGAPAMTVSRKLTLTDKAVAQRARVAARGRAKLEGGPVALPDGRFHGRRPARILKVG